MRTIARSVSAIAFAALLPALRAQAPASDQAAPITLGGVTPGGSDAVNDMTYIFLKVTELLSIRDPNVNARYMPGVNSDAYLKRLCEVNLITAATPSSTTRLKWGR